jgi:hypothetical protein
MGLQELLDREAIRDVIYRYSRGADRHDEALLRSVYHPGARDNHGTFDGLAEDFVTYIMQSGGAGFTAGQHHIGNILIDLDGDVARVESVFVCYLVTDDEDGRHIDVLGGRYWDRFERRDSVWKIADRTVLLDWSEQRRDIVEPPFAKAFVPGRRDATDPTYT